MKVRYCTPITEEVGIGEVKVNFTSGVSDEISDTLCECFLRVQGYSVIEELPKTPTAETLPEKASKSQSKEASK